MGIATVKSGQEDLCTEKVAAVFLTGDYPGSLGRLEISRSVRYCMITFVPNDPSNGGCVRYTWYFYPDGRFDGTSGQLRQPLGSKKEE